MPKKTKVACVAVHFCLDCYYAVCLQRCFASQEVVPSLEEVGLLRDALKQLDQPFLVVVVGEFNSGKSTVINALLGKRFLAEGILPTTNEISVLKFRSVMPSLLLPPPSWPLTRTIRWFASITSSRIRHL